MTLLEKTPSLLPDVFSGFFDDDRFLNMDVRKNWAAKVPAANVFEHDDDFVIDLAAPGMKKDDFKLIIENRTLWISAEVEAEKQEEMPDYTRREFNYSAFKRSFALPENVNVEKIKAKYENGLMKIIIPKLEVAKKLPRKEIKVL